MTTNTDDLVQRLREGADEFITPASAAIAMSEAADAIERRDAEIERLRAGVDRVSEERDIQIAIVDAWHKRHAIDSRELRSVCQQRDAQRTRAETSERELAELRERLEKAPTAFPEFQSGRIVLRDFSEDAGAFIAMVASGPEKRVRLVVEP